MKKLVLYAAGTLVALLILGALILPKLLDPNRYKAEIADAVRSRTGRDLTMTGDISLSFFPFGIELPALALSNPSGFSGEPFARVKHATLKAQLGPLFRKELIVDEVTIDGLALNLVTDKSGKTNWEGLMSPAEASSNTPAAPESATTPAAMTLGKLAVHDASLVWKDLQQGDSYAVRRLNLETGKVIPGQPIDLHLTVDVEYGQPARKSSVELRARSRSDKDGFELDPFDMKLDDSHFTGKASARHTPSLLWAFALAVDQLDVDRYLPTGAPSGGGNAGSPPGAAPAASGESPMVMFRDMNGSGSLRIGKLTIKGIKVQDLGLSLKIADGVISSGPNRAKLYGGAYEGSSTLDMRGTKLGLDLDQRLAGVSVGPLFNDFGMLKGFSGTGSVGIKTTAKGSAPADFTRTLAGAIGFQVANGRIQGVDLEKIIRQTRQLTSAATGKTVEVETKATDETLFSSLSATMKFQNGTARTDDIRVKGNVLNATGAGSADLIRQTMDFRLQVTLTTGEEKGLTVPVAVTGTFAKPSYGVDWKGLAKAEATKALTDAAGKELGRLFGKASKPKK